jgi:hypothetical protein
VIHQDHQERGTSLEGHGRLAVFGREVDRVPQEAFACTVATITCVSGELSSRVSRRVSRLVV